MPVYFQRVYPDFKSSFAFINAMQLIGCGILSNLFGSLICTRLEKKTHMAKALTIVCGNLIGLPFFALACFAPTFKIAITSNMFQLLFMSYYLAPAFTMMQNSTSPSNAGLVVSAETFFSYIVGTLSPLFFGALANYLGALANPRIYGQVIFMATLLGSALSNVFYLRAGKEYTKMMRGREEAEVVGEA